MRTRHVALLPALLGLVAPAALADEGIAPRAEGWFRGDLHFHTNYSDDAKEQGGDWMAGALDIAAYYEDEALVTAFPELEGNGLDFIAVTDHRTIDGCSDPDFQSDRLTVLCGEEFGSDGHAGAWGLTSVVSHEPTDGRTPNEQIQYAVDQTVAMGGVFSPNHPVYEGDPWVWDVAGYTSIEVWNSYWTFLSTPTSLERIDEAVTGSGIENPYIRVAAELQTATANAQGLRFWEAHLAVGRNLGVVGGSDRHMLVMPGQPLTTVYSGRSDAGSLLSGLRRGHTFVSRGPAAPQAILEILDERGDVAGMMGDTVDLSRGPFRLRVTVSRALGGKVRILEGGVEPSLDVVGAMEGMELTRILAEERVGADVQVFDIPWDPGRPAFAYALVMDPLNLDELPPDERALARALLRDMASYGQDYVRLALHLLPLLDVTTTLAPRLCDPAEWDIDRSVCVEVDDVFLGTFHISEAFSRVLNVWMEDGQTTDYATGAITSAVMLQ